ncbi:MAG: DJ-1/PfpI family protein [Chitinispirillales bacterium]|nr:DJ-1/PfpI family protein [Chitinispirillales bacterium]
MLHAITILFDGFEEIEAVTIIDLLRRAEIKVTVLGLNSLEVRGGRDIRVKADMLFDDFAGPFDALILPGGPGVGGNLATSEKLLALIRSAHSAGKICAAICAAPTVLAKAGILEGKIATCYPSCEGQMQGAKIVEEDVATDGTIITSRAVGTAIPFTLKIIEEMVGKEIAEKIGTSILY